jgi:hypothetical protein
MTTVATSDPKTTMRTPERARCCYAGTKGGSKPVRTETPKAPAADDEQGRGLAIVATVAGARNWGIDGDASSRAAWFRLKWDPKPEPVMKKSGSLAAATA